MNISSLSIIRPVLATGLLVIGLRSVACDCKPMMSVQAAVQASQLVIHGQVISAKMRTPVQRDEALQDSLNALDQSRTFGARYVNEYRVVVIEAFKGASINDTLTIRTGVDPATHCGLILTPGSDYVFYASSVFIDHRFLANDDQVSNTYSTSACTRTRSFSRRESKSIRKVLPNTENVRYRSSY